METLPTECYSLYQLHACRATGKNTQYKFHHRNNVALGSRNVPWQQSVTHIISVPTAQHLGEGQKRLLL